MTRAATTTFETYTGQYVDYNDPRPRDIKLSDIARQLAFTGRFAGATSRFYSVAEHALLVRNIVIERGHPELALPALHHDSHEAYLGDWPTPLKLAVGATHLGELADKFDEAIAERLGLDPSDFHAPAIRFADRMALYREAATLKISRGIGPHWGNEFQVDPIENAGLPPERAERLFLQAHHANDTEVI